PPVAKELSKPKLHLNAPVGRGLLKEAMPGLYVFERGASVSLAVTRDIDVGDEGAVSAQDFDHELVVSFSGCVDIVEPLVEVAQRNQRDDVRYVIFVGFVEFFGNVAGADQSSPYPRNPSVVIGVADSFDDRVGHIGGGREVR